MAQHTKVGTKISMAISTEDMKVPFGAVRDNQQSMNELGRKWCVKSCRHAKEKKREAIKVMRDAV